MLEEFEHDIEELTVVPSSGGVFEVSLDDRLIHSKKETGRHADYDEVLRSVRSIVRG